MDNYVVVAFLLAFSIVSGYGLRLSWKSQSIAKRRSDEKFIDLVSIERNLQRNKRDHRD